MLGVRCTKVPSMTETIILSCFLLGALVALTLTMLELRRLRAAHTRLLREHGELSRRFQPVLDVEAERQRVLRELEGQRVEVATELAAGQTRQAQERQRLVAELAAERARQQLELERTRAEQNQALALVREQGLRGAVELQALQTNIAALRAEFEALDEESNLQSFGFYRPRYSFSDSERYQVKLEDIRNQQKLRLKDKSAATCAIEWSVNGSKVEGRKQINQTLKLMLRAFNGECDAAIAKVKYNNINVMRTRIQKAYDTINSLAEVQSCTIAATYLELKLDELSLAHEYEEKLQEEKEEQRRIREQMREEEVALREIEKARQDAEKEEARYADALRKAQEEVERSTGNKHMKLRSQIEELQRKLAEAQTNRQRALSRAQMTRSGHVYVISNIGSFGEQVYKIGMTRRLDPMDRVKELGDASVPFEFDVHAILYTEDAPALENKLHRAFHHRRVNRINSKKEFFRISIAEIVEFIHMNHSAEIEFVHEAEAEEYRKTLALLQQEKTAQAATCP